MSTWIWDRADELLSDTALSSEMYFWLLRERTTKIVGACCTNCEPVDRGPGREPGACTRPVWLDGLCARCWCMRTAFNGRWTLFQANPAASLLSGQKIRDMSDIFGGAGFRTYPPEDWT